VLSTYFFIKSFILLKILQITLIRLFSTLFRPSVERWSTIFCRWRTKAILCRCRSTSRPRRRRHPRKRSSTKWCSQSWSVSSRPIAGRNATTEFSIAFSRFETARRSNEKTRTRWTSTSPSGRSRGIRWRTSVPTLKSRRRDQGRRPRRRLWRSRNSAAKICCKYFWAESKRKILKWVFLSREWNLSERRPSFTCR